MGASAATNTDGRGRQAIDTVAVVETPEHVRFSFELAGPARRVGAYLIDLLLRAAVSFVLFVIALLGGLAVDEGLGGVSVGLLMVFIFFMDWGYFVLLEMLMGGQSVGKRALRMRVVTSDGRPLSFVQSVLRNLLRAADFLPLVYTLGLIVMAQDRRFRRLGDIVANTLVVVEERSKIEGALVIHPPPTPQELYEIPQRPDLSPRDLEALERFLRRLDRYAPAREIELAEMVAPIYAERMGLRYRHPVRFLALLYHRATGRTA